MTVTPRPTLLYHFAQHVRSQPDVSCILLKRGEEIVGKTWSELALDVSQSVAGLAMRGVKRGDRVALASPNRYEWIVTDLAILSIGAVNMPLHNSLTGPQMRFQIVDSGADILIIAGAEQAAKLQAAEPLKPTTHVATFDDLPRAHSKIDLNVWLDDIAHNVAADDLATILYTSGTTGEPKGVMLTHGNLCTNAEACVAGFYGGDELIDRRLNLLPFSHIFARTCDLYTLLVGGSELALADAPQTAVADCAVFQPTLINAVPYFYERVMRKLIEVGMADEPDMLPQILGGRVRHCCSGGAPLPDHVAKFFTDRGIVLTQGYGLTETSPVITMNMPHEYKHGTVGRVVPGVEVRIADDGEILTRGPHVMRGYWHRPAETAAALVDGWFYTGDIGELDADGYLRITGRKKELIVTNGGKKIVPSVVEALLGADPLVKQAVVIGDRRNFLTALIACDEGPLATLVQEARLNVEPGNLLKDERVAALVLDHLRPRLANLSYYEQVQKVALLDRELSVEREELTLTMKLRRQQIAANFADVIERMYAGSQPDCASGMPGG